MIAKKQRFELVYDPQIRVHLKSFPKKDLALIREVIEDQLIFEPLMETRNRKPLDPASTFGDWEIRFGTDNRYRIFYTVDEMRRIVYILAVGEKRGNRLIIGGKEVRL